MTTQCERLHEALKKGPVNPLEAWQLLGIYRVSGRVLDLRERGIPVKTRKIKVSNRFGETCRVAEYYLDDTAQCGAGVDSATQ